MFSSPLANPAFKGICWSPLIDPNLSLLVEVWRGQSSTLFNPAILHMWYFHQSRIASLGVATKCHSAEIANSSNLAAAAAASLKISLNCHNCTFLIESWLGRNAHDAGQNMRRISISAMFDPSERDSYDRQSSSPSHSWPCLQGGKSWTLREWGNSSCICSQSNLEQIFWKWKGFVIIPFHAHLLSLKSPWGLNSSIRMPDGLAGSSPSLHRFQSQHVWCTGIQKAHDRRPNHTGSSSMSLFSVLKLT